MIRDSWELSENRLSLTSKLTSLYNETWFARLFRYLIVSLSNEECEIREGASMALESILKGLSSDSGSLKTKSSMEDLGVLLPDYLLEDIVCVGIIVLVYDNVMSFENEISHGLL